MYHIWDELRSRQNMQWNSCLIIWQNCASPYCCWRGLTFVWLVKRDLSGQKLIKLAIPNVITHGRKMQYRHELCSSIHGIVSSIASRSQPMHVWPPASPAWSEVRTVPRMWLNGGLTSQYIRYCSCECVLLYILVNPRDQLWQHVCGIGGRGASPCIVSFPRGRVVEHPSPYISGFPGRQCPALPPRFYRHCPRQCARRFRYMLGNISRKRSVPMAIRI